MYGSNGFIPHVCICAIVCRLYMHPLPSQMAPDADHNYHLVRRVHRQLLQQHQVRGEPPGVQHPRRVRRRRLGQSVLSNSTRRGRRHPHSCSVLPGARRSGINGRLVERVENGQHADQLVSNGELDQLGANIGRAVAQYGVVRRRSVHDSDRNRHRGWLVYQRARHISIREASQRFVQFLRDSRFVSGHLHMVLDRCTWFKRLNNISRVLSWGCILEHCITPGGYHVTAFTHSVG